MKFYVKRRFATIPNELLNNPNISLSAKGLYAYIQSKPDEWQFSIERMKIQLKEGKTAIQSAIRELESAGYLIRKSNKDQTGRFSGYDYILFDTPQKSLIDKDLTGFPSAENQPMDFTSADLSATISKKEYSKKEYSKKDIEYIYPQASKDTCSHTPEYKTFLDYVLLTEEEYQKLIERLGEEKTNEYIEALNSYIAQIGVKKAKARYKSHYHVILNWHRMEQKRVEQALKVREAIEKKKEEKYNW